MRPSLSTAVAMPSCRWLAAILSCIAMRAVEAAPPGACDSHAAGSQVSSAAVQQVVPAVVRIISIRYRRTGSADPDEGEVPVADRGRPVVHWVPVRTAGSGFVVSADGLVVTGAHVVRDAAEIWVELPDGGLRAARLAASNERVDVALLQVAASGLPAAVLATGDPRPGDWVAAIGAPFGLQQSVSAGVVSAYPRTLAGLSGMPLIQTDVALNPGSSGGPLLDACGEVIGMNSMIFSADGVYIGLSFAVPARKLLDVVARLRRGTGEGAGLGARTQTVAGALVQALGLPRDGGGAVVLEVDEEGPAALAGLREGDVIGAFGPDAVASTDDLEERLADGRPGDTVVVQFWRDGAQRSVRARLEGLPVRPLPAALSGRGLPGGAGLGLDFAQPAAGARPGTGLVVRAARGPSLVAGVVGGDRVLAVNGTTVRTAAEFDLALERARGLRRPAVALLLSREDVLLYVPVRLSPD